MPGTIKIKRLGAKKSSEIRNNVLRPLAQNIKLIESDCLKLAKYLGDVKRLIKEYAKYYNKDRRKAQRVYDDIIALPDELHIVNITTNFARHFNMLRNTTDVLRNLLNE